MKSQLFKNAWKLVKEMKMSFSEALTLSWKCLKNDVKIVINKSWNGNTTLGFGKGNVVSDTVENLLVRLFNYSPVNNDGAAAYYDGKTFNND